MSAPVTTAVTIANSALLKLGADTIGSLTQPGRAALVVNTLYSYLRDQVMGETAWRFATKSVILTPNGNTPNFTWTYAYTIPLDCLRLLRTDNDAIPWVVQDGQILSNEPSLDMLYIYQNTDESSWDARFCEAFAWRLAMELALALTQSIPMKQEAEKSYDKQLAQARAMNAVIGTIPPLEADVWSDARRGTNYFRRSAGQTT